MLPVGVQVYQESDVLEEAMTPESPWSFVWHIAVFGFFIGLPLGLAVGYIGGREFAHLMNRMEAWVEQKFKP